MWLSLCSTAHLTPFEKGLLCKERICSLWEQILSLNSRPSFFQKVTKQIWVVSLECVSKSLNRKELYTGRAMRKCVFGISRQRRPGSACASAQSDQGPHSLLTDSLDTIECMYREQRHRWYLTHARDDLNLLILRMCEGSFSLNAANIIIWNEHKGTRITF